MVHKTIEEAYEALKEYVHRVTTLRQELGVWEEADDSSASIYCYTKCINRDGDIVTIGY